MAKQTVNIGASVNDGSGDTARTAFNKLNQNDTEIYNYLGDGTSLNKLGTAAFKNIGTQAGDVMEVGAFGLGSNYLLENPLTVPAGRTGMYSFAQETYPYSGPDSLGIVLSGANDGAGKSISTLLFSNANDLRLYKETNQGIQVKAVLTSPNTNNTTTDANGFIKAASPIVKLFADKIELNDDARKQNIDFEKLGVGDYLIKGSSGFAQDGWYIETPKDANGNVLFSVIYTTLENGDISVKTYKKKFDLETASIIADLAHPMDITANRWIDLRLQELPQPEVEVTDDPEQ